MDIPLLWKKWDFILMLPENEYGRLKRKHSAACGIQNGAGA
jgi:hypothetical protein